MDVVVATGPTETLTKNRNNALELLSAILLLSVCTIGIFPLHCFALKSSYIYLHNNGGAKIFRRRHGGFPGKTATMTKTTVLSSSGSGRHVSWNEDRDVLFPNHRPLLAIITETDACDSEGNMQRTYSVIEQAALTGKVDLVSIRLCLPPRYTEDGDENKYYLQVLERACRLTKKLVKLSKKQKEQLQSLDDEKRRDDITVTQQQNQSSNSFIVVCSSVLVSVAVDARANGVHVKEHHLDQLADIVRRFDYPIVIGTSTHSVESALISYFDKGNVENDGEGESKTEPSIKRQRPDYYFVGTCYLTTSHPEKTLQSQLEGPGLPGKVKQAICETLKSKQICSSILESRKDSTAKRTLELRSPPIMAIGGIDESNCHEPVGLGADGVAVIRAVLQADHPTERVEVMQRNMMRSYTQ